MHMKLQNCHISNQTFWMHCVNGIIPRTHRQFNLPTIYKKDISCHHQIHGSCEAGMYVFVIQNLALISFANNSCSFQNPRKTGEDDAAYHAWLGRIFKEKSAFLLFYFFLHDKPKFLTLVMDKASQKDDDSNKHNVP